MTYQKKRIREPGVYENFQGSSIPFLHESGNDISGTVIRNGKLDGAAGVFRTYGGGARNLTIENIELINGTYNADVLAGIYIGNNSDLTGLHIRNARAVMVEPISSSGDIYAVVTMSGKGETDFADGFLLEDLDFRMVGPGVSYSGYPNRDGIAIEGGYSNGLIRRVRIEGFPDGGMDIKSPGTRIEHYTAVGNDKSLRLWVPGQHGPIHSINPKGPHLQMMRGGERVFEYLKLEGPPNGAIVHFKTPQSMEGYDCTVRILDWDVSGLDPSQPIFAGSDPVIGKVRVVLPDGTVVDNPGTTLADVL